MMRQSRTSRMGLLQRTLSVEALEDRTLLDGNVAAILTPSGVLQITGDAKDNQFTLAASPTPGNIRVSGNPGTATSINGSAFADFALAAVTDIVMTLQSGQDQVTVTGFSISGALTINYANAADIFAVSNFNAQNINLVFSGGSGNNTGLLPPPGGLGTNGGLVPPVGGGGLGSGNNGGLLPPVG